MNSSRTLIVFLLIILVTLMVGVYLFRNNFSTSNKIVQPKPASPSSTTNIPSNPLQISQMRQRSYPGSNLIIEQTLAPGSNDNQYIASYISDGLKIHGLLTIPNGNKPKNGWPAIIFNHGYISPTQYKTTERYVAYVDEFARNGYVVFKPDFRGNGFSEGQPEGAYYSPAYTIDALNAFTSVKKYQNVDPSRIGMWGHSMGGNITLRSLVISLDIKAAVIWGGVVGTYDDLMNNWQRRVRYQPGPNELALRNRSRQDLVNQYGTPASNPDFWNLIDTFL